ncbi:Membrane protein insertase YidC [Sulfidibacter corallicola]|uniref:Membrane protein insertase YidC n=1 Tax=Sulfidibacter corallicola TaxID=2818388 RepID=A0A8A4TW27_SULCO|nr:membrane protein insertase YidC [Sulfidibacter corallicola]QTD53700.1 membrane protein insertase YidC [Sulfidibacter corallicola]
MEKRFVLAITTCMAIYFLWMAAGRYLGYEMNKPEPASPEVKQEQVTTQETPNLDLEPETGTLEVADAETSVENPPEEAIEQQVVTLENEHLRLRLDNRGGLVRGAVLKNYHNSSKKIELVRLVNGWKHFPGEVLLKDRRSTADWMFKISQPDPNEVVFTAKAEGYELRKTFRLGQTYEVFCDIQMKGPSDDTFKMVVSEGLQPVLPGDKLTPSFFDMGAINPKIMRIAWSEDGSHQEDDIAKLKVHDFQPVLDEVETVVWAGVQDTYFASVFLLDQATDNLYLSGVATPIVNSQETVNLPAVALRGDSALTGRFYFGPTEEQQLETVDEKLGNLVSYGWAGLLSKGLFILLKGCYDITGNWGWAIVVLTLIIKLALFPLAIPSMKSSIKMRQLQPKLEKLRQKYSDTDLETKQKLNQEMFKIYKEEGVNPFSSCLTMLPQMPIFFAYFSLLRTSISLRQAEWLFWIEDLSVKDPTFLLPILMAASMFLTSLSMPMPSGDPTQQKMMKFMPVLFAFFFIGMPAGLVLYMITGNIFTLIQSYGLRWRYENK